MPEQYVGKSFSDIRGRSPFPSIDHPHTANRHFTPRGAFARVGREGWLEFMDDVGMQGDELTLPFAIRLAGHKPFIFSSDFPHEVNIETSKKAVEELCANPKLTAEDKEAILHRNAERLYRLPAD